MLAEQAPHPEPHHQAMVPVKLLMLLNMKALLVVMIFFSVCMGIPTNIATFTLYGCEFSGALYDLKAGRLTTIEIIGWIALLITHAGMICLPFLTTKKYFKRLLISIPLVFITLYILLSGLLIVILLMPFIIVWIVCLIKLKDKKMQTT